MSSSINTIEFMDIVLKSPLPLDQYLVDNSRLSLRLVVNGVPYSETPAVDGDHETGRWVITTRIHVPQEATSFKLAAIVNVGGLKVQLLAVDHAVAKVIERLKLRPDGYRKISISEPGRPIQFTMICNIRLSSLPTGSPCISIGRERRTIGVSGERNTVSNAEGNNSIIPSREDLESHYLKASNLSELDAKATVLSQLGRAYYAHYEETRQKTDLEKAICIHEEVIRLTSAFHPKLADHFEHAGHALQAQFKQNGKPAVIEKAISHYETALGFTDDGDPTKASHLCDLGTGLSLRFERLGDPRDIDEAITSYQRAIEMTPEGDQGKLSLLNNFGNSLVLRFSRLGNVVDVDSAISVQQDAVKITPDGHPDKPSFLNNLGNSLVRRFERLGNVVDVDSAISVQQEAVKITPDGHPSKPSRLNNLGASLLCRFKRLGNVVDVNSSISVQQEAVKITPDGHPDKPSLLNNLGNSLLCRFSRLGNVVDVDSAISVLQDAVKITPDGHPDKPSRLSSLGGSLTRRFSRLGNVVDVDSAISVQQDAVKMTPDGHPSKPSFLNNLGDSLKCRFERLGDSNDLENVLQTYSRAAYPLVGPPMDRFTAAREWARTADQNSRSPIPAFRCAVDLLPRIAWLGLKETDQHALLANIGDVVREAVAAAVKHEEYETAVEWAEQGRSIVWQNLLNLRTPIDDLAAVNPTLANRLKDIGRQLESPVSQSIEHGKPLAAPAEDVAQKYSKLATEWDEIVEEIRRIPNFEGFLGAKRFAQLAAAGSEGPVVILNVHHSRSDALVLVSDESSSSNVSVVNIPLEPFVYRLSEFLFTSMNGLLSSAGVRSRSVHEPETTQLTSGNSPQDEAHQKLFEDLMGRLSHRGLPAACRKSTRDRPLADSKLGFWEILGLLWVGVVEPVLDGLAISADSDHPPHIWWCATGKLSFLPIHAAGIYGTGTDDDVISDYVVSSYTPTLTAILDQSQPIVQADFQILTVAVAQPSFPNVRAIYGTEAEVKVVQTLAKATGIQCISLTKGDATAKRVVQQMVESNWIHFACHGQQNIENSMESGFLLHDRILELSQIVKLQLPKADFAFLSACQTATGDEKIAEESVHLAAGMLLSGCRGVIATMWSIDDSVAPRVAENVYGRILKDGRPNRKGAAYALHEAVKGLRSSGVDFLSWVPFIHIGR